MNMLAASPAPTHELGVAADLAQIAAMIIVAVWALIGLAADAFAGLNRGRMFQRRLALAGIVLASAAAATQFGSYEYDAGVPIFSGFLVVDQFSLLLDLGILFVAGGVTMFAGGYARAHRFEYGEQESLIFIAAFGMMILAHSADLLAIFLGIETMSIAVYVMVGARWNSRRSSEAGLKYFIMGAFSSGLLLMGIALLYGGTGTTSLILLPDGVLEAFRQWSSVGRDVAIVMDPPPVVGAPQLSMHSDRAITGISRAALVIPGILLTLGALLFKLSAVPFHMWTPDAYDGAPTPATAFMAAGVKIGGVAALLKIMIYGFSSLRMVTAPYGWTSAVAFVALLTMTVGNLAAVRQTNVKRLLAFSSIAHVGYLLVGVVAAASFYGHGRGTGGGPDEFAWSLTSGDLGVSSVVFYVLTYAVATMGAFACVAWYGTHKKEGLAAHEWSGLAQRHPGMALGMTACLLSLMGMPPTAGFMGKLFVFRVAFSHSDTVLRFLVVAALVNAVIGAYYYLRLVVAMYFRPPPEEPIDTLPPGSGAPWVVAICAAASIGLGVAADPVMRRAELAAAGFTFRAGVTPVAAERRAAWVDRIRARWEAADKPELPPDGGEEGTGKALATDAPSSESEPPKQEI